MTACVLLLLSNGFEFKRKKQTKKNCQHVKTKKEAKKSFFFKQLQLQCGFLSFKIEKLEQCFSTMGSRPLMGLPGLQKGVTGKKYFLNLLLFV